MLIEKANDMNELRTALEHEMNICRNNFDEERGFIFYGLPGVGKTTTVFKMGRLLKSNNEKIMVISLDQRISSVAYIKEVAIKLKCEAKVVNEPKELYKIMHKEI